MMTEEPVSVERVSYWRYVGIWLALMLGMGVGLSLSGQGHLVLNFYAPLLLTLGCGALLGLSAICIWGLPLILPMGCLCHGWLHGRERWWRLLPGVALLMALLSAIGIPLAGQQLPMFTESSFWEAPAVPSDEEMEVAYAATLEAWGVCARASGIILLAIALHILVICGWSRTWSGVRSYYQSIRSLSRSLRETSVEQERQAALERGGASPSEGASSSSVVSQEGEV